MPEITSLEQCFSVERVMPYVTSLEELVVDLNDKVIKVADESQFGKKVFYCGDSHVTVKEKVKKANVKTGEVVSEIKELEALIQKKAYEQRIKDLGVYVEYCNEEIAKIKASISEYQSILEKDYANIETESDFGVQNRMNSGKITEWKSTRANIDRKIADLEVWNRKLQEAKGELTNAKIMIMHNYL